MESPIKEQIEKIMICCFVCAVGLLSRQKQSQENRANWFIVIPIFWGVFWFQWKVFAETDLMLVDSEPRVFFVARVRAYFFGASFIVGLGLDTSKRLARKQVSRLFSCELVQGL